MASKHIASRIAYYRRNLPKYIQDKLHETKLAFTLKLITNDPPKKTLFDFENPSEVARFRIISDKEIDGKTEAHFDSQPPRSAVFHGNLSLEASKNVIRSGYAGIICEEQIRPFDLSLFDAFHFRIRGDGRLYTMNLKTSSRAPRDDIFQCFLKHNPHEWTDVILPFDKFLLTWRGYVKDIVHMNLQSVENVGVALADKKDGPFRLEIEHITAVQRSKLPPNINYLVV